MPSDHFRAFIASDDTLRVYHGKKLVFSSKKNRLLPLMEYIASGSGQSPVLIYDKVMGNAAALLAVIIKAAMVYSPLGSELAVKTLDLYGVKYHLIKVVPFIMRDDGQGLCPMEQLSIGKTPDEFYKVLKAKIEADKQ